MRIVSLIASSTEIVCALGLRDQLVGRSHECDYPGSVLDLPVLTAPKFKTSESSYMIDERVRAILQESLSVYRVDADLLNRLKPTHIITQTQCEVCAVSLRDVEAAAGEMIDSRPQIIALSPDSLADIYEDIRRVGTACGVEPEASRLVKAMQESINEISEKCSRISQTPSVALIEWIDPLMPGGNWMPELVRLSGGRNLFGREGQHSQVMAWKDIINANPDFLIIAPCGFTIAQTLESMPLLLEKKGWSDLACVREHRVYIADGHEYFNRPGPRVLESLQVMAEIIHPHEFHYAHEGKVWMRYAG